MFVTPRQRLKVKARREFWHTHEAKPFRIFDEELAAHPERWVLYGSFQSSVPHLIEAGLLDGGVMVWSLWDGYLEQDSGKKLLAGLEEAGVPMVHHHTSGHASLRDLRRLVKTILPSVVVPIHTEAPHRYAELLDTPVVSHPDGQWWPVRVLP